MNPLHACLLVLAAIVCLILAVPLAIVAFVFAILRELVWLVADRKNGATQPLVQTAR